MGAGARLAEERDRWPEQWRVADLEQEEEHLLDLLEPAEELRAAVPAVPPEERRPPVLIGVTDRRLLLITRTGDGIDVIDATDCAPYVGRTGPIPFRDQEIRLEVAEEHLSRLWALVDEIGR